MPTILVALFASITLVACVATLVMAWELFSKVFDFTLHRAQMRRAKKTMLEAQKNARLFGGNQMHAGIVRAGPPEYSGASIQGAGNVFSMLCTRGGVHSSCNGRPRPDCTNGR